MKAFSDKAIYGVSVSILLLMLLFGSSSCNIKKHIPPGRHLLGKVKIKGEPTAYSEEVYALLKQKPNKRILGAFRLNMWSYLWANKSNIKKRRERKLKKLEEDLAVQKKELKQIPADDNEKRADAEFKIVNLENKIDKQRDKVNNLSRGVFEAPVLLDTMLSASSASQIQAYLFNKGYFHNAVSSELRYGSDIHRLFYYDIFRLRDNDSSKHKRKTKATIIYHVNQGEQFRINKIDYLIYDSTLYPLVLRDSLKSEIKLGKKYDGDALARERERLYILFRENGYYNFSREYIYYGLDSTLEGNDVNIYLGISNPPNRNKHRVFKFDKIYIEPEYFLGDSILKDTVAYQDFLFVGKDFHIKPSILSDFIFFHKDTLFHLSDYQSTLSRLSQLNLFRFVDIQFGLDTLNRNDTGLLTAYIRLTPLKRQELNTNLELNYTDESTTQQLNDFSKSFGLAGSIVYRNRNISKTGLQLEIRPRAAIEIPVDVSEINNTQPSYEFGIGNSLIFPQLLLPWKVKDQTLRLSSQTALSLNLLYENNRNFNRTTFNTNLTYQITKGKIYHYITPIEVSLVNTGFNSSVFEQKVKATRDPLLINLFDQHIITDARYAFVVGQQPITNVTKRYWFFRNSIEVGGNAAAFASFVERKLTNDTTVITDPTHKIFNINYYQYIRNEFDIRFYTPVWHDNNFASRLILGFGMPYGNSSILPFERRFYVGGSNSIRAWRLRELGPGQYKDNNEIAFDKSGDIKIETNAEFRFPVYGLFKCALFLDAGNVWTYKEDASRPGSKFKSDSVLNQFAIGTGLGLRFDFTFFVVRVDLAVPLRDPSKPVGERYVLRNIKTEEGWLGKNIATNIGIGYPF